MSLPRGINTFKLPKRFLDKLLSSGFETSHDVLEVTPMQIVKECGVTPEEAVLILQIVKEDNPAENMSLTGQSAGDLWKKKQGKITTMCKALDECLGGGVTVGNLTEFCGEPGVGKTQLAMQLACDAQIPVELGGVGGGTIYVDTEGSFHAERFASMAQALLDKLQQHPSLNPDQKQALQKLTLEQCLQNVIVYRLHNYSEQLALIQSIIPSMLEKHKNVRLLVIDSIAFHFRRGFTDMAKRARLLTSMANNLANIAATHNVATVLINHVTSKMNVTEQKMRLEPALGASWAHACQDRWMLKWGILQGQDVRFAELVKSSSQKYVEVPYQITEVGFRDIDVETSKRARVEDDLDDADPSGYHKKMHI